MHVFLQDGSIKRLKCKVSDRPTFTGVLSEVDEINDPGFDWNDLCATWRPIPHVSGYDA